MKKGILKFLSVVLAAAMLVAVVPSSVWAQNTDSGKIRFGVITDTHYYAQANIDDKAACTEACEKTISASHLADSILATALNYYAVMAQQGKIDYLIIPGDLTKDGDYVSHTTLAQILENWEERTGIPVLVTNGNHDINNPNAQIFADGKFVGGQRSVTPQEFKEIYANLGFDLAVEEFTPPEGETAGMLSYVAQLKNGYRLIVMDGGKYSADNTESGLDKKETGGNYSPATLDWCLAQTESAKALGYSIIGMTHWNFISHFGDKELTTFVDFCIDDSVYVRELFADAGMQYVFTGHMHIHDIAQAVTDKGNIIYDIATSSLINFPNLMRTVTFDNTVSGVLKADFETHSFDELEPLTYNGKTYPQPFSDYSFGINFVGDSAKTFLMDLVGYYLDVYLPEITEQGGLYNFLCNTLDLESLIDGLFNDLLGGGIKLGAITILGTRNAMGLIKDLCDQLDEAYVNDPDRLTKIVSDLLDNLLNIQVSEIPCTKFLDTYGFGDASRGGTLADLVSSVIVYMYYPYENPQDDTFLLDARAKLETGAISELLLDELIEHLVNDFLLDELFSTLELHLSAAFPIGTFGSALVFVLDTVLNVLLLGDTSLTNLVDVVFSLLGGLGVLEFSSLNGLLDHYIAEYLTLSQFETIDGELASFVDSMCFDEAPDDLAPSLTANLNGGYEVEATAENLRLPSNVAVTFGEDAATSRNISWFTKKSVDGTDIQLSLSPDALSDTLPEGVTVEKTTEATVRTSYGIDIGIAGLITYEIPVNRHCVSIKGLQPDTVYYYRLGDAQTGFWSKVNTITTADNSDSFTFFHVSDSQAGLERHYDKWANLVETAFGMYPDASFIMHTGDHVDHGDNFVQWQWLFNSCSDTLMDTVLMPTAGNHEGHGDYALSDNFIISDLPEQDETTGLYYSFDYNNAHFMVLNANDDEDDAFSQEQIDWLKADATASDAEWKIVATHKAVYSNGSHYDDGEVIGMRAQLSTLMPELGVDIVLQGHDHVYLRTDAMNNNEVVEIYEMSVDNNGKTYTAKVNPDGTVYAINGCSGVKYYQTKDAADTDELFPRAEAIVDATYPVFAAIRIEGNNLYFDSYGVTDSGAECIDSFAIVHDDSIQTPKYNSGTCPLNQLFPAA